jgi:hypothetical protein
MGNKVIRKLTDEEKQKVIYFVNDVLPASLIDNPAAPTAEDIAMKQKIEEFTTHLLKENEPQEIESLLDLCNTYTEDKKTKKPFSADFALIVLFDMWYNKTPIWPAPPQTKKDQNV